MGFGREGYEKAAHKFQKMKEYNSQICQIIVHTQYQKEHNQAWSRNELLEDFRLCQCRLPETWLRSSLLWLREESFPPISLHNRVFADYKQMQGITLNSGRRNERVDTRPLMSVMTSYAAVLFSMLITTRMTSVVHFPPAPVPERSHSSFRSKTSRAYSANIRDPGDTEWTYLSNEFGKYFVG